MLVNVGILSNTTNNVASNKFICTNIKFCTITSIRLKVCWHKWLCVTTHAYWSFHTILAIEDTNLATAYYAPPPSNVTGEVYCFPRW